MLQGRIAPTAIVVGESQVWRAEIGSSDNDASGITPSGVVAALELVAGSTGQAIVEESSAESCCVGAMAIQIAITTSST